MVQQDLNYFAQVQVDGPASIRALRLLLQQATRTVGVAALDRVRLNATDNQTCRSI
jgi:hypothetical protein